MIRWQGAAGYARQLDGCGGVRKRGGVTLESDLSDLSDVSDKMGAPVFALTGSAAASHVIPRGFAVPLCGGGRAKRDRWGVQGNLMAAGVCESAGA